MSDTPPPATVDIDSLIAAFHADSSDITVFFPIFAAKLYAALPGSVDLEREKALLKRNRRITRITVHAGDDVFDATLHDGTVTCRQTHTARGATGGMPFAKDLDFDDWVTALFQLLANRAQNNALVSAALRSLVT